MRVTEPGPDAEPKAEPKAEPRARARARAEDQDQVLDRRRGSETNRDQGR